MLPVVDTAPVQSTSIPVKTTSMAVKSVSVAKKESVKKNLGRKLLVDMKNTNNIRVFTSRDVRKERRNAVSELISLQTDPVVLPPVKGRKPTADERRWVIQRILAVPKKWNEKTGKIYYHAHHLTHTLSHTHIHALPHAHTHSSTHTYRRLSTVGRQWDKCMMTVSRHLWDCQIPQK